MKNRPKAKKPSKNLDYFEFLCLKTIFSRNDQETDIFDVLNSIRASFQRRFGVQQHPSGFICDYKDIDTICRKLDDENYISLYDDGHIYLTSQGRLYLSRHNQPSEPASITATDSFWDREPSHWSVRYFEEKQSN